MDTQGEKKTLAKPEPTWLEALPACEIGRFKGLPIRLELAERDGDKQ